MYSCVQTASQKSLLCNDKSCSSIGSSTVYQLDAPFKLANPLACCKSKRKQGVKRSSQTVTIFKMNFLLQYTLFIETEGSCIIIPQGTSNLGLLRKIKIRRPEKMVNSISFSTIVLYSRDHKGVGVAHEIVSPKKTASISPDNDEAVLIG